MRGDSILPRYAPLLFLSTLPWHPPCVETPPKVNYAKYSAAPWLLPMGGLLSLNSGCAEIDRDTVQIVRMSVLEVRRNQLTARGQRRGFGLGAFYIFLGSSSREREARASVSLL